MTASSTSICNAALLMLGDDEITALGDESRRAKLANSLYPMVRDAILRSHLWNCATTRAALSPDETDPVFGYAYQFTLPSDFLRVVHVGEDDLDVVDYKLETVPGGTRKILSDENPLYLRYVFRNKNESTWDDLLVYAVTIAMRHVLAYPITQSTTLEQAVGDAVKAALAAARGVDAQDEPSPTVGTFRLLNARY